VSLSLLCMISSNASGGDVDKVRLALESSSAFWFSWVKYAGYAVAVACLMEAPETFLTMKRWFLLKFRGDEREETAEEKISWYIPLAAAGLIIVVIGIAVETFAEGKVSDIDALERSHESDKITAAEEEAGIAVSKAAILGKYTAQLQKDEQDAKRDMVKAQLELARFNGPIQSVPVVNGIASPDPIKGSKLRILLHRDTLIKFPTLPKGKALSWILFIVEDEEGQHQFTTSPKQFMPPNRLFMPPGSSATMDLVTDETGTSDHTLGGATLAVPPPTTVVIK
jgi:hypothetical protein